MDSLDVLCIYDVKQGKEDEFQQLLATHWTTLQHAGLVSSQPATVLKTKGRSGKVGFVEMFQWNDNSSTSAAHNLPDVLAIWGPMEALTDKMEFLSTEPVEALMTSGT